MLSVSLIKRIFLIIVLAYFFSLNSSLCSDIQAQYNDSNQNHNSKNRFLDDDSCDDFEVYINSKCQSCNYVYDNKCKTCDKSKCTSCFNNYSLNSKNKCSLYSSGSTYPANSSSCDAEKSKGGDNCCDKYMFYEEKSGTCGYCSDEYHYYCYECNDDYCMKCSDTYSYFNGYRCTEGNFSWISIIITIVVVICIISFVSCCFVRRKQQAKVIMMQQQQQLQLQNQQNPNVIMNNPNPNNNMNNPYNNYNNNNVNNNNNINNNNCLDISIDSKNKTPLEQPGGIIMNTPDVDPVLQKEKEDFEKNNK